VELASGATRRADGARVTATGTGEAVRVSLRIRVVIDEVCEYCGDEVVEGRHLSVSICVARCDACGGIGQDDERWDWRPEDRCCCVPA
jgi:hypothetical protein